MSIVRCAAARLALALILASCVSDPLTLENTPEAIAPGSTGRAIEARACGFQLLLLVPLAVNSRAVRAYKLLRIQTNREVIRNVAVTESWTYGLVGTLYCTDLDALAYPAARPASGPR